MAKRAFKYQGDDISGDDELRDSQRSGGSFESYLADGVTYYKPREGENNIRLLPCGWEDIKTWGKNWDIEVWVHMGIGVNEDNYLCLDKMKGEECPICQAALNAEDKDEKRSLSRKLRPLAYVIDRDNERAGPQAYAMPITLNKEIHARSRNKKTRARYKIDHPEEGFDVSFTKEGKNLNTKYVQVNVDIGNPSPLSTKEARANTWLEYIMEHPLPELLVYYEADHIEAVLNGASGKKKKVTGKGKARDDDDDDEGEEEKPKRGAVARKRSKADEDDEDAADERAARSNKRRVEAEDDEEEDEAPFETDEDDEDEPKSRKAKPKGKASKLVDDEDDEEEEADEEEEDEDEKPARRAGKGRRAKAEEDEDDDAEEDEGDSEDEEDEDDKPRGRKSGKPARRASARDEEEDDEDEADAESDEDDEEDEDEPHKTSGKAKAKLDAMKRKKAR